MSNITIRSTEFECIYSVRDDDNSTFTYVIGRTTDCQNPTPVEIERWIISTWQCCDDNDIPHMHSIIHHYERQGRRWMLADVSYDDNVISSMTGRWVTIVSDACWVGDVDVPYLEYLDRVIANYDSIGLELLTQNEIECTPTPDTIWIRSNLDPVWQVASLLPYDYDGGELLIDGIPLTNSLAADNAGIRYPWDNFNGQCAITDWSLGVAKGIPPGFGEYTGAYEFTDATKFITCSLVIERTTSGMRIPYAFTGAVAWGPWRYNNIQNFAGLAKYLTGDCIGGDEVEWVEARFGLFSSPNTTIGETIRIVKTENAPCDDAPTVYAYVEPIPSGNYSVVLKITAKVELFNIPISAVVKTRRGNDVVLSGAFSGSVGATIFEGVVYELDLPRDRYYIPGVFIMLLEEISSNIIDGMLSVLGPVGTALASIIDVVVTIE